MDNGQASTACDKIILSGPDAGQNWIPMNDMPVPRVMGDSVILPS